MSSNGGRLPMASKSSLEPADRSTPRIEVTRFAGTSGNGNGTGAKTIGACAGAKENLRRKRALADTLLCELEACILGRKVDS